jgi:hypothetical protein
MREHITHLAVDMHQDSITAVQPILDELTLRAHWKDQRKLGPLGSVRQGKCCGRTGAVSGHPILSHPGSPQPEPAGSPIHIGDCSPGTPTRRCPMAGRRCEVTDVREVLRRLRLGEPDRPRARAEPEHGGRLPPLGAAARPAHRRAARPGHAAPPAGACPAPARPARHGTTTAEQARNLFYWVDNVVVLQDRRITPDAWNSLRRLKQDLWAKPEPAP